MKKLSKEQIEVKKENIKKKLLRIGKWAFENNVSIMINMETNIKYNKKFFVISQYPKYDIRNIFPVAIYPKFEDGAIMWNNFLNSRNS